MARRRGMMRPMLDAAAIRALPKVLLHDHLDGGLRPATVVELARETGYRDLPTTDPDDLGDWFRRGAARRSLELYLETFAHTVGVMGTPEAVERVAAECAEDLAADGVVYAEVRFAPELVASEVMTVDEVIAAAVRGLRSVRGIETGFIVCAMRDGARSLEVAEAAVRLREAGVCGFDIAGPEAGFPPSDHRAAFQLLQRAEVPITIHAGEAAGAESIADALACGAHRLGHGLRVTDQLGDDGRLGLVAETVHTQAIPLELCPTSNVHTGAVADLADHPVDLLRRRGFAVTVNTDNRLMSGVTLSGEIAALCATFGWGATEVADVMRTAARSAFLDDDRRRNLLNSLQGDGR
jgi:adenosine deaminase